MMVYMTWVDELQYESHESSWEVTPRQSPPSGWLQYRWDTPHVDRQDMDPTQNSKLLLILV